MRKLLLVLLCLVALPLISSHIVGGEFELLHVNGSTYRLNLIIYFDRLNGAVGARDQAATVTIFRKRDNAVMQNITLPLSNSNEVSYTQPECSSGELGTDRLLYTSLISLPASQYNDSEGYYVSWQRCCRNYSIVNIFSDDPATSAGTSAGQTFYLEFPPVVKDGNPFINSSPSLFPPLNDFACPNRYYYVDFAGQDADGDSLVYSMATPLNTRSAVALPPASPRPYPDVQWRPGYSLSNIIQGSPDLRISTDGLLTGTPSRQGLFVFAVKVEEFRNRQKIGESRRDFQMLVVDNCPVADPPQILGKRLTDTGFDFDETMNVFFSNTVPDEERCIEVQISDPDASKADQGLSEDVRLRVVGLNFKDPQLQEVLPEETTATLVDGSTKTFKVCFPRCPYVEGGTYQIGLIATDDACSLPLLDTLKVNVTVQPPANSAPYFTTGTRINAQLDEGSLRSWNFQVRDDDNDEIVISVVTDGFQLANAGMTFEILDQQNGLVNGRLTWNAFCDVYDFTGRNSFNVKILANDKDECDANDPVVAEYSLNVVLPGSADPIIDTDLTASTTERVVDGVQRKINSSLSFNVFGSDLIDNDFLVLRMVPVGFRAADYGMTFTRRTGRGSLQSQFNWDLRCATYDWTKTDFELHFIAVDSANKCRFRKADTVTVKIKVLPPDNEQPVLTITPGNAASVLSDGEINATLGSPIVLNLLGVDEDFFPSRDLIKLSLNSATGSVEPEGYEFASVEGLGNVATTFTWNPDCSIFVNDIYENNYTFKFVLADNKCVIPKADTVELKVNLRDVNPDLVPFDPVNVFTPNGDDINDYYAMERLDPVTGQLINILPPDNCVGTFERVQVFNRWGKLVFESRDRNFRWYGSDQPAGVYFYHIQYNNREYKGPLSLRD